MSFKRSRIEYPLMPSKDAPMQTRTLKAVQAVSSIATSFPDARLAKEGPSRARLSLEDGMRWDLPLIPKFEGSMLGVKIVMKCD